MKCIRCAHQLQPIGEGWLQCPKCGLKKFVQLTDIPSEVEPKLKKKVKKLEHSEL